MPIYSVQGPDGRIYELEGPAGASEAEIISAVRRQYLMSGTAPAAAPKEGLMADVMGAGANLLNIGRTGIAALTGDTTQAAQAGVARQEELQKKYKSGFDPEKITAPFEQGQYGTAAGEALKQVPSAVATVAPSVLQTAGLAAAGRLGGGALGSLLGPVGTVAGAQIGQYALPAVVGFIQALGGQAQEKVQTQKEAGEKPDVDALALAPYAAGSAALDLIGAKVAMPSFFKKMGGQKVAEETADAAAAAARSALIADARKVAGRGTFETILRGTGGFALGELPTEVLQEVLDRAAVGKSLTDDEAMKSYRSTALLTVLAAPIGAGVGVAGRSGARTTVEQEDKQIAAKAAAEAAAAEEAARTTPEALTRLDTQYQDAKRRMAELQAAVAKKPTKASTPEEKQAYTDAKQELTRFQKEDFAPLSTEYAKRKDAISAMQDAQLADIEQKAAVGQPTAAAPVSVEEPKRDVQKLMLEQDTLRRQLEALEGQLGQAAPEQFDTLNAQRQELQRRIDARATLIEEAGGSPLAQAEFEQATSAKMQGIDSRMEKLTATYTAALEAKDYDAAAKAKDELLALRQERTAFTDKTSQQMQAMQEKQQSLEQRGQTRELGLDEPAQPPQEGLTFTAPITAAAPAEEPIKSKQLTSLVTAQQKVAAAQEELDAAVQNKTAQTPAELYPLLDKLNQAQNASLRASEDVGRPTLKPTILDIFSPANLFNTAYANGDTNLLNALARQTDSTTLKTTLDEKASEREKLTRLLDTRLDLAGQSRERADLFSKQYEPKQQALFKNGTYPDKELQDLYDKGGPAAVEYENVMSIIEALSSKVTTKQGNAKKSLYEKLVDLAEQHAELTAQMETGIAVPTKGEKVAALQAKLGKGEVPAARQMDAAERNNLQRRITTIENAYRLAEGKVAPIRDQVARTYASLYITAPKTTVVKEQADQRALLLPAKKQETLATDERDDLRKIAVKQGRATDAYKTFIDGLKQRLATLVQKHGSDSSQVKDFKKYSMAPKAVEAKALELGKETPAYQKALKGRLDEAKEDRGIKEFSSDRTVTRAAKTVARIAAGNVRKEAEASESMRELALKLGQQMPEYETLANNTAKRLAALKAKYGNADPAVAEFRNTSFTTLQDKAVELGKTTPEYKATLKEQIAYFQEVLPTAGKQVASTKRSTQVTRKQTAAPNRLVTSSPESRKETEAEGVREKRRMFRDFQEAINDEKNNTAYRLREGDTSKTVDPAEAQKVIDGLKLPENVKFVYAPTTGKIPVRLLNMMAAEGVDPNEGMVQGAVFSDGTVLVVGDQHTDVTDLEKTIAHEIIGHYGVDTVIGLDKLNAYAKKTDVIALAEQIGGKGLVADVMQTVRANAAMGRSEEVQKLQALREIIAHTEEARVTEAFREKAGRWMKELVGMVRAGLRAMGLQNAGALSTSDVFYMLKQSRKAFENKTIGVYRDKAGQIAFRSRRTPGEFDADPEPSAVDTLLGNVMGLAGRMQLVDKYAAVSQAFKTGMSKGVLTDVEAGNAEFLLRFGEHRSQYANQFITNGPVSLVTTKTDKGVEHTYKSTKGPTPLGMAEALSKGGFANDSEAEGLLGLVTSGERAKQVGWEKLNYSDPAAAKAKYERALAHLEANPKQKAAIKEAMAIYQKFNNGLMDFLVQVGELTSAKAAELKAITYVPFYRVTANGEVQLMIDKERPVRIGNIKDEPQLQQLVGDNKQIMPIFASMVQNTFMLTNLGLRNQTVKETAFTLRKIGIASRIGKGPGPASPNIVRFKKNGEDMHVVIDTDMYGIPAKYIVEGMEGIKTTIPAVVKLLGIPADLLRKFVTRAPPYAIRQTIRDPLNAWLTTGTDAFPVLSSFKELGSMVAGRSETERILMESGAVSSNVFTGDERDMSKVLREITSGKAGWTKLLAKADAFALQGDTATRAVIYRDSIAKGMSHQQALLRSVESMNFSRRGLSPSIQMLSTMIPFFNAQIQGLDVLYRAFKGDMSYNEQLKIREKLFQRGMLLAIGTMAYAAAMQDDEAYKRAKPEERYGNWFVYVPGVSEPLRVPIPFELGYLFKALPEAVYNLAAGDEKASDAAKGIGKLLGQSNPFALPQAVKPLTEVVLGSSFFSGDIESEREKNVLATDRYRDSSTEVSKLLGSVTGNVGLSPIKIDYLIRGYTGGLGIALVQLANPLLNTEAEAGVEKPSMKPSKIPFIGGLFQPVEGRGTLDSAYDKMLEIQQVKGTYNDLIEKGKRAEAQAFAQQYSNQLALASTSGSVQKALGEMAKQERFIRNSKMTTEQKDAALERLDKMKVAYARQFISLADRTTPR